MSASETSCAHCGKQGAGFKRCSVCKDVSYCGAKCQNAAWKGHKKLCLPMDQLWEKLNAAYAADGGGALREILKFEGRLDDMLKGHTFATHDRTIRLFVDGHRVCLSDLDVTYDIKAKHALAMSKLQERRITLLSSVERFRDAGEVIVDLAGSLILVDKHTEAALCFQRARKLGELHGLFALECSSTLGLGHLALVQGRDEEAAPPSSLPPCPPPPLHPSLPPSRCPSLPLPPSSFGEKGVRASRVGVLFAQPQHVEQGMEWLRHALTAVPFCEEEGTNTANSILHLMTETLLKTGEIDEVAPPPSPSPSPSPPRSARL